jgi:hypothetical protein
MRRILRYTILLCAVALIAATGATAGSLITGAKVKDGSLTGRDVKNRSLTPADFARAPSVQGRDGRDGVPGVSGPSGSAGATGSHGLTGLTGDRGAIGAAGATGSKGDTGAQGLQGEPGSATQTQWAEVTGSGVLSGAQKGSVSAAHISQGVYTVTFSGTVADCLPMATPYEEGTAYASIADDNMVQVMPLDTGGANANLGFRLLVVC